MTIIDAQALVHVSANVTIATVTNIARTGVRTRGVGAPSVCGASVVTGTLVDVCADCTITYITNLARTIV